MSDPNRLNSHQIDDNEWFDLLVERVLHVVAGSGRVTMFGWLGRNVAARLDSTTGGYQAFTDATRAVVPLWWRSAPPQQTLCTADTVLDDAVFVSPHVEVSPTDGFYAMPSPNRI